MVEGLVKRPTTAAAAAATEERVAAGEKVDAEDKSDTLDDFSVVVRLLELSFFTMSCMTLPRPGNEAEWEGTGRGLAKARGAG